MPTSQHPLPQINPRELTNLSKLRMDQFRGDASATSCGHGWLMVDDRNVIGNKVLLISKHAPLCVMFEHSEPYHDHMRACILAQRYASNHPQQSIGPAVQLVVASLFSPSDASANDAVDDRTPIPSFA